VGDPMKMSDRNPISANLNVNNNLNYSNFNDMINTNLNINDLNNNYENINGENF
jgi:hypothetical protein